MTGIIVPGLRGYGNSGFRTQGLTIGAFTG